jgi:hypothetical protein
MKDSSEESDDSSSAGWSDKVDSSSSSSSSSSESSTSSHSEEEDPLPPAKSPTAKEAPQNQKVSSAEKTTKKKGGDASKGKKAPIKAKVSNATPKSQTAQSTPPKSTPPQKSSPEVRGSPSPLEKPRSPDAASRSFTPPRSPTRTMSPPLPPASSSMNSLVSGRLNEAMGESAGGTDSAPTMPTKSVSANDMYTDKRGSGGDDDDDDDSSSGSGSNDSFKSSKTRPESGEKLEAAEEQEPKDPPKRRSFFGRFGAGSKGDAGAAGTDNPSQQDDASTTKGGYELPQSEEAPDADKQQPPEEKSQRKGFGLFRSGRKPSGVVVDPPSNNGEGDLDADVPAEDVIAAQNEEVKFEAAPEEAVEATKKRGWLGRKSTDGDPPVVGDQPDAFQDEHPAASPKRASWFSRRTKARATTNDTQELNGDVETGKFLSPSNTAATAREYGNGSDDPRKKTRRFIIYKILVLVILAGAAFGAAYGGVTLANQAKSPQPTPGDTVPSSPCENDDVLLNLTMRFDAKPDKIGIELKDFGTANSAIWSFPSGSFRSFTQLRRTNVFQICLNPLPQYELSITSNDGTGLASEFAGTYIFGSWQLTYNGTVVSTYNGDCNVTNVPTCGSFSSCDFILAGNSTKGACTAGASPTPSTNATVGTNAPQRAPPPAPATSAPFSALPTTAPVTAATQATTAAPATASPGFTSAPATTTPASSPSPATTPPESTTTPLATTVAPSPAPL